MLKQGFFGAVLAVSVLAGCDPSQRVDLDTPTVSGRELRPAKTGIDVGSLYYVREAPTSGIDGAADLQDLCIFKLAPEQLADLSAKSLPDMDILKELDGEGALTGIKTKAVSAGLEADIEKYFSYKLTNVQEVSISLVEAQNLFDSQAFRDKCKGWRRNIEANGWAAYQVLSVVAGDMVFERRSDAGFDAEVSAKIAKFEPKLKSELRRKFTSTLQGKGLVVSFHPLLKQ